MAGGATTVKVIDGQGQLQTALAGSNALGQVVLGQTWFDINGSPTGTLSNPVFVDAGVDTPSVTAPVGGSGVRGWLSAAVDLLRNIAAKLSGTVSTADAPFTPIPAATVSLVAGPSATSAPLVLPTVTATTYRIRNSSASASPVAWRLFTTSTGSAVIPTPYTTAGTGGAPGDKQIEPGGIEIFSLTAAQQSAIAAGSLYLSAITDAGGSAIISITPGVAGS